MATIEVCSYTTLFVKSKHIGTSFRFINGDTGEVLDENINDKVNLLKWTSELAKGDGTHYRNLKNIKGLIRFHYEGEDSRWFSIGESYDQTKAPPILHSCAI